MNTSLGETDGPSDAVVRVSVPEPSALTKLQSLFSRSDQKRLVWLLLAILLMALLQVVGIAAVLPFLNLAADPEAMIESDRLGWIYRSLGLTDPRAALVATGIAVVVLLALSNAISAYLIWLSQRMSWSVAHHLSMRLVNGYVALPYTFFLVNSSSDLIKKNINDVNAIVNSVLLGGTKLISNLVVSLLILILLSVVEPMVTLVAAGSLLTIFGAIAVFRKQHLSRAGRVKVRVNQQRFRTFVDLVVGIKTVKTDGAQDFFLNRFSESSQTFSEINPRLHFASVVPRYVVEVFVLGGVVVTTTVLVSSGTALLDVLPALTLFALAAYRLIPAISSAYSAFAAMVSDFPAIDSIYQDLQDPDSRPRVARRNVRFKDRIVVREVSFRYDAINPLVLSNVSLTIGRGDKVAFVGPSGSGKSTLIDIIVGLFPPLEGEILIDGITLDGGTKESWRDQVGYVPQTVFLYDDSMARNIAFGQTDIDPERLAEACKWAQLDDVISNLPDGMDTLLGERGVRLSGGERQRIGLARAFYRRPEVLVLDEATSALDRKTESAVIASIEEHLPNATILMIAHRISTVRNCDRLYVLDRGRIISEGTFEDLIQSSGLFQELATIS